MDKIRLSKCKLPTYLLTLSPLGNVTMGDVYLAMPWSNTIDVVKIK